MDQSSLPLPSASSQGDSSSASAGVSVSVGDMDSAAPDRDRGTQSFASGSGRSVSTCSPSSLTLTLDSGLYSGSASAPSSPTKEMSPVPVSISLQLQRESPPRYAPNVQLVARHNIQQFKTDLEDQDVEKLVRPKPQPRPRSPKSETCPSITNTNTNPSSGVALFEHRHTNLNVNRIHPDPDPASLHHEEESLMQQSDEMRDPDLSIGDEYEEMEPVSMESDSKVYPMAFTVDFGEDTKKSLSLDITDSISKFAPRHRKNLSLTKGDEFAGKKGTRDQEDASAPPPKSANAVKPAIGSAVAGARTTEEEKRPRSKQREKFAHFQKHKPSAMDLKDISNNNHLRLDSSTWKESKSLPRLQLQDDNASETGTYTLEKEPAEVRNARKRIDKAIAENARENSASGQEGAFALGWVREWAESAAHQRVSPISPEVETQGFLHDTENLVSALQRRVTAKHQSSGPRDKIILRATGASPAGAGRKEASVHSDSGYALGYASDSSTEGFRRGSGSNPVKYNRAFAIRRGRVVGYDSDNCGTRQGQTMSMGLSFRDASPRPQQQGTSPSPAARSSKPTSSPAPAFSRTDGGRFSLRAPKSKSKFTYQQKEASTPVVGQRALALKPFQNPVDGPMRKQVQGLSLTPNPTRKDFVGGRSNSTLTAKEVELANWKRRKNYDPMKAAAGQQSGNGKKKEAGEKLSESGSESLGEDPCGRTRNRNSLYKSVLANSSSFAPSNCRPPQVQDYYVSDDDSNEIPSSHSSSPTNLLMSRSLHGEPQPQRPRNKLEALDSLVISTIHSLSIKVRTSSRQLLEKLQSHYSEADENGALLEEMVTQLKDLEAATSPTKTTSRELSGTLKNLKKIEQVILVLDRVLCEDESDPA